MMKKIIRGAGLLALCMMAAVVPVKAAEDPVSLSKDDDGVKVVLSKEAIDDEVHSLHLNFEVDVTKGSLAQSEVSFDWAISDDAYKTQFIEEKDGKLTLDIYTSAKQDLFPSTGDGLTLGVVKLTPAKGSVTAKVAVTGNVETVNGVQELNKVEGAENASVEVTAGKSSGGKKPSGGSSSHGSGDSDNNSSGAAANNNQTAKNNNNANANNVIVNPGINNSIVQAVPENNAVQNSVTSQNKKGKTSGNKTVQNDNSSNSESDAESEITGVELSESEEVETEQESLSESEAVSTADADDGDELAEADEPFSDVSATSSGMGLGMKVFLGIIIIVVVAAGVVFAVRLSNKKKNS